MTQTPNKRNEIQTAKFKAEMELDVTYRKPESISDEDFLECIIESLKMRINRKGITAINIKLEKYDNEQQL